MIKLVVEHLGEEDRASANYLKVTEEINKHYPPSHQLQSNNICEITKFLSEFNSNCQPLLVTILSHGNATGISALESKADDKWLRIGYVELLPAIANSRTQNRLTLNLTACCHSDRALNFLGDNSIDEIWFNKTESDSLYKGLENAKTNYELFSSADINDTWGQHLRRQKD